MSNIILIGMPACGKSTVGVILAKTVGKTFIDTDLLIQEKEGALLQDIINIKGNDYFKNLEERILCDLQVNNAVVSTGGSAVYYENAMEHLRKSGKLIYLKLPLYVIESRLNNISTRGITMAKGETIADLYERRTSLYEKEADIVLESEGMSVEETVEAILNKM
ncbi:MAG: shikimate kinase [Anaerovorax sp.]|nr:shikimate kinase [Anaerovorax sp.]